MKGDLIMVHYSEDGATRGLCTASGDLTDRVRDTTCDECLFHLVTGCLEGTGLELEALGVCLRLAQLANPELTIRVEVA
jgi:hypothetical protein